MCHTEWPFSSCVMHAMIPYYQNNSWKYNVRALHTDGYLITWGEYRRRRTGSLSKKVIVCYRIVMHSMCDCL